MEEFNSKDLKEFEEKYNAELETGNVSQNTQFNYAWYLIKSPQTIDVRKGVSLLQELCTYGIDQRDFLYFLAEGNYKLAEYSTALRYINRVLNIEPNNKQAKDLKEKIEQKMRTGDVMYLSAFDGGTIPDAETLNDGLLGAAITGAGMVVVGGTALAVAGAAALVGLLVRKK